jgi:deoxyribonuclease V
MNWIERATKYQEKMGQKLTLTPPDYEFKTVCGVDASFKATKIYGVACLFSINSTNKVKLIEKAFVTQKIYYPYVSGFLAFREGTALINAIKKLKTLPTVILVDGHGIAHPRGFGIASWIGYLLKVPTIGCAKNKLIGEYKMPKIEKGEWSPLVFNKKIIGAVLRTREKVKPIFISPGNLIDLETSITLVLSVSKYRIPEPLRIANMEAKRLCGS